MINRRYCRRFSINIWKVAFSALRREVRKQNEDGTVSNEVKERTYNLKSSAQGE